MENRNIFLSIIIIGYNTEKYLKGCLDSINLKNDKINDVEVIYVDDGSTDRSVELFNTYPMKYQKKTIVNPSNLGRNHARNSGINNSSGEWCLFTNSNMKFSENTVQNFYDRCRRTQAIGISGSIQYLCSDTKFQNYLNHQKRGLKQFKDGTKIPSNLFLFSNSCVKKKVFDIVGFFDKNLIGYGGSELEMAKRIESKYPDSFVFASNCRSIRKNHPGLSDHIKRLEDFGANNFNQLINLVDSERLSIVYRTARGFHSHASNWLIPIFTIMQKVNLLLIALLPNIFNRFIIKFLLGISLIKGASYTKN